MGYYLSAPKSIDKRPFQVRVMVFNATFNNISVISWQSVLLVEETGVPGENHRPVASHWQTSSHNVTWTEDPSVVTAVLHLRITWHSSFIEIFNTNNQLALGLVTMVTCEINSSFYQNSYSFVKVHENAILCCFTHSNYYFQVLQHWTF